ncbi:MAG: AsmA family protein [Methylotenera sp.]|nr:AsmA family protein [Methylotenera sp.]
MLKSRKIVIWLSALISLLIILPFLIPTQSYLNEAERVASDKFGVPVTIASVHWSLLPSPRVVAEGITVGKLQEIKVAQIVVIPTLSSLFSSTKVLDLRVNKPIFKHGAVVIASTLFRKHTEVSKDTATININNVKVEALQFDWPAIKLPLINLNVNFKNANVLTSVTINAEDEAFKAVISSKSDEYLISMLAKNWISPVGLPLLIDSAKFEMILKGSRLYIPIIDVALYDGKLTGNANVSWGKDWHTSGKLKLDNVSIKEPSRLVSKAVYFSGHLFSSGDFSSSAKEPSALADNIRADFKFNVNSGVLNGMDLVKVASILIKQGHSGGETEFDELSGLLNVADKQYNLRNLKISSGLLSGTGQVKIKANEQLNGDVEIKLKHSASLVAIPLNVSGTLNNPVVLPSTIALAGALAGTAILGPGVGTSLGIKAGGVIGKFKGLFQNN